MSAAAKRSRYPRINSKSAAKRPLNWLTEDLIVEVFLRLPKKSLLRFRRVSKALCNLIDSPVFKKRYDLFHNSVSDFSVMQMEAGRLFSIDFHLPDNLNSCVEKEVSIPHNNKPRFIGSCKGIVCLTSPAPMDSPALDSYVLLNPFNRTYQKVKFRKTYVSHHMDSMGFGYDCSTDDYKIVILEPFEDCSNRYLNVYSMRRDSWRQVTRECSPGCSAHGNGICVEGVIHWLCSNNNSVYTCIAAFDLETDVLRSFLLPSQLMSIGQPWSLHDLGGRLCIIVKFPLTGRAIVWVMEEYGVETSWTQLFGILNDITFVVGYFPMWDNARLLCLRSDARTLSWLNTQDGSKEDIQIDKLPHQQGDNQTWNETWVCVRSPLRLRCS